MADQSEERRPGRRDLSYYIVVVLILVVIGSLPIWHRHRGFNGVMHGHAIWGGNHVH